MTGPIDVAYVELRPEFGDFDRRLRTGIDRALKDIDRQVTRTTNDISRDFTHAALAVDQSMTAGAHAAERALENLGDKANREFVQIAAAAQIGGAAAGADFGSGFSRDANGRLRDSRGKFVAEAGRLGAAGAEALGAGLTGFERALNSIGNSVSNLAGSVGTGTLVMGAAFVSLIPIIITVGSAIAQLAGLIATLPAASAVLGAAIVPLIVGFSGFGAALKKTSSAGGAAVDTTQQVAAATYRLSEAQRQARRAQEDITRAREEAARQLEDLSRALVHASLDERGAVLALEAAEKRQRDNRRGATRLERAEAQLAVDEARQNLDDVRARNERLGEDAAVAAKKGVNGSDQVTAALEQQRQATHAVADAQTALTQARNAGGGGGGGIDAQAAALAALAPAARAVAQEFIALQPAFTAFRQGVQQALFAPLQGVLTTFATQALPTIQAGMEGVAGSFGKLFAGIGKGLSSPKAVAFFDKLFASTSKIIDTLAPGILDLFGAFGAAAEAGLPFLERFGTAFSGALTQFAGFIEGAIKDGSFQRFIEDAIEVLKELGPLAQSIGGFLGAVFTAENAEKGKALIEALTAVINAATTIIKFFDEDIPAAFGKFYLELAKGIHGIVGLIGGLPGTIGKLTGKFVDAGRNLIKGFFNGLKSAGGFVGDLAASIGRAIKDVLNQVIGGINWAIATVDNVLPGSLPRIPMLAAGGMTTGPMIAGIGEAGREAVIPLDDSRTMTALAEGLGSTGQSIVFGPGSINVSFDGSVPSEVEARRTGAAVGQGILSVLRARNVRTQVRTI